MTPFFVEDPFYDQEYGLYANHEAYDFLFRIFGSRVQNLKPALKIIIASDFRIIQIIIVNLQMKI